MKDKQTPRERFLRLAVSRTHNALDKIAVIGNLASKSYDFEHADVSKIIQVLSEEVATLEMRFAKALEGGETKSRRSFSLEDNQE